MKKYMLFTLLISVICFANKDEKYIQVKHDTIRNKQIVLHTIVDHINKNFYIAENGSFWKVSKKGYRDPKNPKKTLFTQSCAYALKGNINLKIEPGFRLAFYLGVSNKSGFDQKRQWYEFGDIFYDGDRIEIVEGYRDKAMRIIRVRPVPNAKSIAKLLTYESHGTNSGITPPLHVLVR